MMKDKRMTYVNSYPTSISEIRMIRNLKNSCIILSISLHFKRGAVRDEIFFLHVLTDSFALFLRQ